ncbi:MAG: hypothetical protein OXH37_00900 [Gammaproteobacteria bacterium]|nr:hypothetical protein [Gammaproteobacteria bacterium]
MVWIRWLLTPLTPIAVAAASLVAGLLVMRQLNQGCPPDRIAGGQCVTAEHITALGVTFYAVVLLAVIGGGWVAALLAPKGKRTAGALACFLIAAAPCALYVMTGWPELAPVAAASVAGAGLTLWWISARERVRTRRRAS